MLLIHTCTWFHYFSCFPAVSTVTSAGISVSGKQRIIKITEFSEQMYLGLSTVLKGLAVLFLKGTGLLFHLLNINLYIK